MLTAQGWHGAIAPALRRALEPHRFEEVRRHHWVQHTPGPIRPKVEVQALKGGQMGLRWGLSLDYVPHVEGRRTRWHRTAKSARLDYVRDPLDRGSSEFLLQQDFFKDEAAAEAEVADRAKVVTARLAAEPLPALLDVTIEALPGLFEAWMGEPADRFDFWNYVQAPIAYAFTLRYLGRPGPAREWLSRAFERQGLDTAVRSELSRRLEALPPLS